MTRVPPLGEPTVGVRDNAANALKKYSNNTPDALNSPSVLATSTATNAACQKKGLDKTDDAKVLTRKTPKYRYLPNRRRSTDNG